MPSVIAVKDDYIIHHHASCYSPMNTLFTRAFSLLELLISLTIISILMGVALPSYQNYLTRARYREATHALQEMALQLQYYYLEHHTYEGAAQEIKAPPSAHYRFEIHTPAQTQFTLHAYPIASQAQDTVCGTFKLNELGIRARSGTGEMERCWR